MEETNKYLTDKVDTRDDIDVLEMLSKLLDNKRALVISCILGAVFGLVLAFSIPKLYKSSVVLAPETEQAMGAGISSIASMMGVNFDNSIDAINATMFPDIVKSTPFVFDMLDLEVETKEGLVLTMREYMLDHQKKSWFEYVLLAPLKALDWLMSIGKEEGDIEETVLELGNLPREIRVAIRELGESVSVSIDKKTGITTITTEMQDPYVSATYASAIVDHLKDYMYEYRTSKARQDVENLAVICEQRKEDYYRTQKAYADFADSNKGLVKLNAQAEQLKLQQEMQLAYQVYSQVATQLEGARIKEQQAKPVFVVLEPVSVPLRKSFPSKPLFMIVFAFLGTFAYGLWILFIKDLIQKIKK